MCLVKSKVTLALGAVLIAGVTAVSPVFSQEFTIN
jgi:hypothetical protein